MSEYATWELMRDEITRNLDPDQNAVAALYRPIGALSACDDETYYRLVSVRLMASYQAAVTEYLHPRETFKQSSLHGEAIALGSVAEKLLEIALVEYESRGLIMENDIRREMKQWPRRSTYYGLLQVIKKNRVMNVDATVLNDLELLRKERNSVHLGAMAVTDEMDVYHHEYDILRFRKAVDRLATSIGGDKRLFDR